MEILNKIWRFIVAAIGFILFTISMIAALILMIIIAIPAMIIAFIMLAGVLMLCAWEQVFESGNEELDGKYKILKNRGYRVLN